MSFRRLDAAGGRGSARIGPGLPLLLVAVNVAVIGDHQQRVSQPAEVRQRMGDTEIAVIYNRPSARGRELFGALIPYDSVWNPGADEATRIELGDDVIIDGQPLGAGQYSLWLIPRADAWTLIFSRAYDVYHTPYPQGRDALRVQITPERGPHMETLAFLFPIATRDSVRLEMRWGTLVLPLSIRPAGQ